MDFDESYQTFLKLLDHPKIRDFLKQDECRMIADKYLLATVFIFFRKANLHSTEYNKKNFYISLYLAHDIHEDNEDFKNNIMDYYLGPDKQFIRKYYNRFLKERLNLFQRMGFHCNVTQEMCRSIMKTSSHWAWKRVRHQKHAVSECSKCDSF